MDLALRKMIITQAIIDKLTEEAKASPRLRQNMDLRNSDSDGSQRMLNRDDTIGGEEWGI